MKKTLKIILIGVGILLLAIAGYLIVARPKSEPVPPQTDTIGDAPGFVIPPEGAPKMTVPVEGRPDLEVNNVYNSPVANLSYNGVLFKKTDNYEMFFYPEGKSFTISVQGFDLNTARESAEADFLQTLGIERNQACDLNVTLGTTFDVSPKNAGRQFGLSFCPNSKPFE